MNGRPLLLRIANGVDGVAGCLAGWLVQRTTDYNIPIYNNNGEAMEN